jgi:hypothetical protein
MAQPVQAHEESGSIPMTISGPFKWYQTIAATTKNAKQCQAFRLDGVIVAATAAADGLPRRALRFIGMGTRRRLWALS